MEKDFFFLKKTNRRRNDPAPLWRDDVLHGPDAADCSLLSKVRAFGLVRGRATPRPRHSRTCRTRAGAFKSQQQLLFPPLFPLFALWSRVTHLNKANRCVGDKIHLGKFGKQKEKIEEERSEGTEALSSFWKQPKLYAVETSRNAHKGSQVCSRLVGYLTVDVWSAGVTLGYLMFMDIGEETKTRFCC